MKWRVALKSPVLWLALVLVWSLYGNHRSTAAYTDICEAIAELHDGYTDPVTKARLSIINLDPDQVTFTEEFEQIFLLSHQKQQELHQADTEYGRAYRWWFNQSGQIMEQCSTHLRRAIGTR